MRPAVHVLCLAAAVASPSAADDAPRKVEISCLELWQGGELPQLGGVDETAVADDLAECLERARGLVNPRYVARTLSAMSMAAVARTDYEDALAHAESSLSAARAAGDDWLEGRAFEHSGDALFYLEQPAEAADRFASSLEIFCRIGDRRQCASQHKNLGTAMKVLGRYGEALAELERAAEIAVASEWPDLEISVQGNLGVLYRRLGAYELARSAYSRAAELAEKSGSKIGLADAMTRLGVLDMYLGEYEQAREHLDRAAALARDHSSTQELLWVLGEQATAHRGLGRATHAEALFVETLELRLARQDLFGATRDRVELGYLALEQGRLELAASRFENAISAIESRGYRHGLGAFTGRGLVRLAAGDHDGAIAAMEEEARRFDAFRNSLYAVHDQVAATSQNQYLYEELIAAYVARSREGDLERAFHTLERARARRLVEAISESAVAERSRLPARLELRREEILGRLAALRQALEAADLEAEERGLLLDELERVELQGDALVVDIRARSPELESLRYPEPVGPGQIQARLEPGTALIAFTVARTGVIGFRVTRDGLAARVLPVEAVRLEAMVRGLRRRLEADRGWQDPAERLYAILLAPLLDDVETRPERLIIVPDRCLNHLPFEALVVANGTEGVPSQQPNRTPRLLIEDSVVSYSPSCTVLEQLSASGRRRGGGGGRVVVFANPRLDRVSGSDRGAVRGLWIGLADEGLALDPIPFTAVEAERIARIVGPGARLHAGTQASETRVKELTRGEAEVVHFATHGLVSLRQAARSALLLTPDEDGSEDGFLQVREIAQLELDAELVILSACQTARGRVLAGEGVQGVAQAFFNAGARSVVGTLWNVSDRHTADLMAAYYRLLADGHDKAAALRLAKLELLASAEGASPRFWAPFLLFGEPSEGLDTGRWDAPSAGPPSG